MPEGFRHPQLAELVDRLIADRNRKAPDGISIVYPDEDVSLPEITVCWNGSAYVVSATSQLAADVVARVLELGFSVGNAREGQMVSMFGPHKGEVVRYRSPAPLYRRFAEADQAAIAALKCAAIIWGLAPDEWMWITTTVYDERPEMQRPALWPPFG